jgi:signal transduction histidine kinase
MIVRITELILCLTALFVPVRLPAARMRARSISDSGSGTPPNRLNEVFDAFFTTRQQGMGIGLLIARTIVQAHKGRIWAENVAGGGAVFRLTVPLCLT